MSNDCAYDTYQAVVFKSNQEALFGDDKKMLAFTTPAHVVYNEFGEDKQLKRTAQYAAVALYLPPLMGPAASKKQCVTKRVRVVITESQDAPHKLRVVPLYKLSPPPGDARTGELPSWCQVAHRRFLESKLMTKERADAFVAEFKRLQDDCLRHNSNTLNTAGATSDIVDVKALSQTVLQLQDTVVQLQDDVKTLKTQLDSATATASTTSSFLGSWTGKTRSDQTHNLSAITNDMASLRGSILSVQKELKTKGGKKALTAATKAEIAAKVEEEVASIDFPAYASDALNCADIDSRIQKMVTDALPVCDPAAAPHRRTHHHHHGRESRSVSPPRHKRSRHESRDEVASAARAAALEAIAFAAHAQQYRATVPPTYPPAPSSYQGPPYNRF